MLLLATFRDTEADVPAELAETLADLRRSEGVVRLRLGGLTADEVGRVRARAPPARPRRRAAASWPRAIERLTEGNAFLVSELWRALVETGALDDRATAVRLRPAAGRARARRRACARSSASGWRGSTPRPATCSSWPRSAGPAFDLDAAAARRPARRRAARRARARPRASGMIEEMPGPRARLPVPHELVRRALYDRLPRPAPGRAAPAGRRGAGGAPAPSPRPRARRPRLPLRRRRPARRRRSARSTTTCAPPSAASAALAFDEAAIAPADRARAGRPDDRARAEIQLELGLARYRAGRSARFAGGLPRGRRDGAPRWATPELLARAAIGYRGRVLAACDRRPGRAELLEEASRRSATADATLRVALLVGPVRARCADSAGRSTRRRGARRGDRAWRARIDDRAGLADGADAARTGRAAPPAAGRARWSCSRRHATSRRRSATSRSRPRRWNGGSPTLMALGDLAAARGELRACWRWRGARTSRSSSTSRSTTDPRSRSARAAWRTPSAAPSVRASGAAAAPAATRPASTACRCSASAASRAGWRSWRRWCACSPASDRAGGAWRPGLAALLTELGMDDEARRELAADPPRGPGRLRRSLWLASLTYLADASPRVGDARLAGERVHRARPFRGRTS